MSRSRATTFTTIRTEGALLPADFLQRLAEGSREVPGLTPEAYHLAGTERLHEAISRSWNRLLGVWAAFQSATKDLAATDPGVGVTREKWLLPLFQELGYGRLLAGKTFEVGGKAYPISHAWQHTPIHLVGRNVDLDRRSPGVAGAARISPHGLVQEFLNRSDEHLWGILANGLRLRLLRESKSLTRQAYVECDLAAMMEGQAYSDFALLWLLCHQSRVEAERPAECWLEKWAEAARAQGTRALETLREGVEQAIAALGRGFLAHPANATLIEKLRVGTLATQEYYRQLLRGVYRLIFLFVAEDRDLLLVASSGSKERDRYQRFYSMRRIRTLAERRRGGPHGDLWLGYRLLCRWLGSDSGCPDLGVPALGSYLWSAQATPDLDDCSLANAAFLEAVRQLAFTTDAGVRRAIDYRNLGPEELGSVYESLLELNPDVNLDATTFSLKVAGGHERKTSGSYYTPDSLVQCLLDSALEPVMDEAAKGRTGEDAARALLALKICDPAVGSGHFLIAAAHRLARRVAIARLGEDEPSPEATRTALRDVIGRCLYGVDVNPMAAELCRVSLWLEALEPGKPLSFLDHHIRVGNSLLGATPELIAGGLPDEAFTPIEGDDKKVCSSLKKRNKQEREGQWGMVQLMVKEPDVEYNTLASRTRSIDEAPDNTIDEVQRKAEQFQSLVVSPDYRQAKQVADAWCAAFVWKKDKNALLEGITTDTIRRLRVDPNALTSAQRREVEQPSSQYQFFHWHLAFPEVFAKGGFDCVLGNPPWEQQELKEKEWFATRRSDIATAATGAQRKRMIEALAKEDKDLYQAYLDARRYHEAIPFFEGASGRYPLCGTGRINTYAVFAEVNAGLIGSRGRVGCILPSGIATDDTTKSFFQRTIETERLISLYDFENKEGLFPGVHREQRFALVTIGGTLTRSEAAHFAFYLHQQIQIPDKRFALNANDIALLNPNTRTCPIFRDRRDSEITIGIYRQIPVLCRDADSSGNPWGVSFSQGLFNMTSDSGLFRTKSYLESQGFTLDGGLFSQRSIPFLPLYEGKLTTAWDHRAAGFAVCSPDELESGQEREIPDAEHGSPHVVVIPRFWIAEDQVERASGRLRSHFLTFHAIANPNNERSAVFAIIPYSAVGHSLFIMHTRGAKDALALCALGNSFAFDYIVRNKVGSRNFSFFTIKQIAAIPPNRFQAGWFPYTRAAAFELSYTAWDLLSLAHELGWDGPPFRWDSNRRFTLRCELDAAFFHLYGIARGDVNYIMDTFPIVRRKDEEKWGEYRTKRVILEIYDAMQESIRTSHPYQTRLFPPPADPRCCHPPRERGQ